MLTQHALPVVAGLICSQGYYIQVIYAVIILVYCNHIIIDYI